MKVIAKPAGMGYHFLNPGMIRAGESAKATDLLPQFLAISRADQVVNCIRPIPAMIKFFWNKP